MRARAPGRPGRRRAHRQRRDRRRYRSGDVSRRGAVVARHRRALGRSHLADPGAGDLRRPGIGGAVLDTLRRALDHKDAAAVAASGGKAATVLQKLLAAAGAAKAALRAVAALDLGPEGGGRARAAGGGGGTARRGDAESVASPSIRSRIAASNITPASASRSSPRGSKTELGRGGRYLTGVGNGTGEGEDATGFTLYTETVLAAMTPHRPAPRHLCASREPMPKRPRAGAAGLGHGGGAGGR